MICNLILTPGCGVCRAGDVQGYKRVDGPSEDELKKKHEEGRKNSPFSNPSRECRRHTCIITFYSSLPRGYANHWLITAE